MGELGPTNLRLTGVRQEASPAIPALDGLSASKLRIYLVDTGSISSTVERVTGGAEPDLARLIRVNCEIVSEAAVRRVVRSTGDRENRSEKSIPTGELVSDTYPSLYCNAASALLSAETECDADIASFIGCGNLIPEADAVIKDIGLTHQCEATVAIPEESASNKRLRASRRGYIRRLPEEQDPAVIFVVIVPYCGDRASRGEANDAAFERINPVGIVGAATTIRGTEVASCNGLIDEECPGVLIPTEQPKRGATTRKVSPIHGFASFSTAGRDPHALAVSANVPSHDRARSTDAVLHLV